MCVCSHVCICLQKCGPEPGVGVHLLGECHCHPQKALLSCLLNSHSQIGQGQEWPGDRRTVEEEEASFTSALCLARVEGAVGLGSLSRGTARGQTYPTHLHAPLPHLQGPFEALGRFL